MKRVIYRCVITASVSAVDCTLSLSHVQSQLREASHWNEVITVFFSFQRITATVNSVETKRLLMDLVSFSKLLFEKIVCKNLLLSNQPQTVYCWDGMLLVLCPGPYQAIAWWGPFSGVDFCVLVHSWVPWFNASSYKLFPRLFYLFTSQVLVAHAVPPF